MLRTRSVLALALGPLAAPLADAQSDLVPAEWGLAATASYAGAVFADRGLDVSDVRGPGAAVDATWRRVSAGVAGAWLPDDTVTRVSGAVHLARDLDRQVVTSLGVGFQMGERSADLLLPSLSHSRRVSGGPAAALIASVAVGGAMPTASGGSDDPALTAAFGLTWLTDRGPLRTVISPSVAGTLGQVSSVSVGLSLGLAVGGD